MDVPSDGKVRIVEHGHCSEWICKRCCDVKEWQGMELKCSGIESKRDAMELGSHAEGTELIGCEMLRKSKLRCCFASEKQNAVLRLSRIEKQKSCWEEQRICPEVLIHAKDEKRTAEEQNCVVNRSNGEDAIGRSMRW